MWFVPNELVAFDCAFIDLQQIKKSTIKAKNASSLGKLVL